MISIGQYKIWKRVDVLRRHLNPFANPDALKTLLRVPAIEWAMRTGKDNVRQMPIMIKVEPTNICSLRCPGCYSHNTESWTGEKKCARSKGKMSFDTFKKIVDELGTSLYKISLYGQGEPLLNQEVFDMVRYASDGCISCVISTNFNVNYNGIVEKILDCGLEHLIVAVDTLDPENYAAYRKGGNLETVLTNLEELTRRKQEQGIKLPLIEVQSIIRQNNHDEIPRLREFTRKIGADRFSAKMDSEYLKIVPLDKRPIHPCYWLWYSSSINWDGTVSPCGCALISKDFVYGDITQERFEAIWNSEKYRNSRLLFSKRKRPEISHIKECYACPIFPNVFFRKDQKSRGDII